MPRLALDFVLKHVAGTSDPLTQPLPWYVLMELSSQVSDAFRETMEEMLGEAMEPDWCRTRAMASRRSNRPRRSGASAKNRRGAEERRRLDQARYLGAGRVDPALHRTKRTRR